MLSLGAAEHFNPFHVFALAQCHELCGGYLDTLSLSLVLTQSANNCARHAVKTSPDNAEQRQQGLVSNYDGAREEKLIIRNQILKVKEPCFNGHY